MPLIEFNLEKALYSPVEVKHVRSEKKIGGKKQKSSEWRSKASRTANTKYTEVMVRITGFGRGAKHVNSNLLYMSRNGKVEIENELGERINGGKDVRSFSKDWVDDIKTSKRYPNRRDTMHLILSMPEGYKADSIKESARSFAKENFGKNHEYVMALHTDTKNPHCHITVKMRGHDGKRLDPRKEDIQKWRESFVQHLAHNNIVANATPRRSRGVVRKGYRNSLKHIRDGDKYRSPRTCKVDASKKLEIVEELQGKQFDRPWEKAIKERQEEVRSSYLKAVELLDKQQDDADKKLAQQLKGLVQRMPQKLETERHVLAKQVQQEIEEMKRDKVKESSLNNTPDTKKSAPGTEADLDR